MQQDLITALANGLGLTNLDASGPAAPVPTIHPKKAEDFPVFRETFLSDLSGQASNRLLRRLGDSLYLWIQENRTDFPDPPEDDLLRQLRAAQADLRYLQGFLESLAEEFSYSERHHKLSLWVGKMAGEIRNVAKAIGRRLGPQPLALAPETPRVDPQRA